MDDESIKAYHPEEFLMRMGEELKHLTIKSATVAMRDKNDEVAVDFMRSYNRFLRCFYVRFRNNTGKDEFKKWILTNKNKYEVENSQLEKGISKVRGMDRTCSMGRGQSIVNILQRSVTYVFSHF